MKFAHEGVNQHHVAAAGGQQLAQQALPGPGAALGRRAVVVDRVFNKDQIARAIKNVALGAEDRQITARRSDGGILDDPADLRPFRSESGDETLGPAVTISLFGDRPAKEADAHRAGLERAAQVWQRPPGTVHSKSAGWIFHKGKSTLHLMRQVPVPFSP
jgi:hypothetical protein